MPEGPSIVILKEEAAPFKNKKVLRAVGNAKIDIARLKGKKVCGFKSWGKHFIISFNDLFIRIHFLMFGSYRINEKREMEPRLSLAFRNGEMNFYNCSVKMAAGDPHDSYEWSTDVMSDDWNAGKALASLKKKKNEMVCDVLLDQEIFSGVGNIIKNEILFRIKVQPGSRVGALSLKSRKGLVAEARNYSFDFYRWKKKFELKKHWKVYKQAQCPDCGTKLFRGYMGKRDRLTFFCPHCQRLQI